MLSEMTRAGGRHVRVRRRSRSTSRRAVLIRVHANLDCELAALAAVDHDRAAAGIRRRVDSTSRSASCGSRAECPWLRSDSFVDDFDPATRLGGF